MRKGKTKIYLAMLKRVMREEAKRVSKKALVKMAELTEEFILEVTKRALAIAEKKKRKTIREEDLKEASKQKSLF